MSQTNFENDWWDRLPKDLQDSIDRALLESELEQGISHEDVLEKYSQYFIR